MFCIKIIILLQYKCKYFYGNQRDKQISFLKHVSPSTLGGLQCSKCWKTVAITEFAATHTKNRDNFKDEGATIKPCQHTHSQSFENWENSCRRNTGNCDSSMRKPDKSTRTYILDSSSTEVFYLSEVLCRANVEYEMSNRVLQSLSSAKCSYIF